MARMLGNNEVAFESARSQFWIVDAHVSRISKILFLYLVITFLIRVTLLCCSIKVNCMFYQISYTIPFLVRVLIMPFSQSWAE
jgi:hypothetical protein